MKALVRNFLDTEKQRDSPCRVVSCRATPSKEDSRVLRDTD